MTTGGQIPDSSDTTDNNSLTYDWENCETLQAVRAFTISDYGTKSDYDQTSDDEFMVPDPSISGIAKSTTINSSSSNSSTVEENYIMDNMSVMTDISNVKVSNAPQKHEYGKERVGRKGNIYDKLYNASLKGQLNIVKDTLEKHNASLTPDENGQTALYAACIGNHLEIINLLIDNGYDVNHQDNEGKTPLHIAFENNAPGLAEALINQFSANIEIRDVQSWTPLHTAIDRGYFNYSKELSDKFLHQDIGTGASWIQLHAACFQENMQDVQFLLKANTDVNYASSAIYTPLHIAVIKSNANLVTLLLDQAAYISCKTIDGQTPLHIAVDQGDEIIIQKLFARNADPSLQDVTGNTSLHLAVQLKQKLISESVKTGASNGSPFLASYHTCSQQTVQSIIGHGADVNAINNRGQTALWFACTDGQNNFVKVLLDAGADPNIADKYGDSCLHAAINGQCNTETMQKMVDQGADVNVINKDGATPLLLACSIAQAESVALLLSLGADPNMADADGETSILNAIEGYCSVQTMQKLIDDGASVNAINNKGLTALLKACAYRQMDVVNVLLEAGADPTIVDDVHYSSLHAAVDGRCSLDTLQALIDHGAHIDAKRKDGTNALLRACSTGQSESVIFLLEAGANVKIVKPDGNTCLHAAVDGNCRKAALQKIIQSGVSVDAANNKGQTALISACYTASTDSVKFLLESAADPNISDPEGYTSLHAAVRGCCINETLLEIIKHKAYLDAQNKTGQTALLLACLLGQHDSVTTLLKAGSITNIPDNDGDRSLHTAVLGGCSKKIIKTIIRHGSDVNATNKGKVTALMTACQASNANVIKVLLNAGADPNTVDANGYTCLHYAGGSNQDVFQTIIDYGANVNARSKDNVTTLVLACQKGNADAVNVLLNAGAEPYIEGDGTWLHDAVRRGYNKEVLQAVINHGIHGVDVNATNNSYETALAVACLKGNEGAISVLLDVGANPNIADAGRATCLHKAVDTGCSNEVLQSILDHGADINATNTYNRSALMIACQKGKVDAIIVLLNAGANPNIVDANGYMCLHAAVLRVCIKGVIQAIIGHGAHLNATNGRKETALLLACWKGNEDAISVLLDAGADPNIANAVGTICLHTDIEEGCSSDVLQAIICHGVHLNATDRRNETALSLACWEGNEDAISVLLDAGADPNIVPCLHIAIEMSCSNVLQAIIDHGADVNAVDKSKRTALTIAFTIGNTDVINILLSAGADPNITKEGTLLHYAVKRNCCKEMLQAIINHCIDINAMDNNQNTAIILACLKRNEDAIGCTSGCWS